jgi:CBS domain-containing protein
VSVADLIKSKGGRVVTVPGTLSVEAAARKLIAEHIGALVVQGPAGRVLGVLSERDFVEGLAERGAGILSANVAALMRTDVLTCAPGDSMVKVMAMMTDRRVRHLPVMDGDTLVGIVSVGDAVKYRIGEIEGEARALREYITG